MHWPPSLAGCLFAAALLAPAAARAQGTDTLPAGAAVEDFDALWTCVRDNHAYLEQVAPRGPFTYEGPPVVLVGRWTASMDEGMAIALDGLHRATVVGTPMAGLLGATHGTTLPRTGWSVRVPAERLYHVDGTPREAFVPAVRVDAGAPGENPALAAALAVLRAAGPRPPGGP